MKRIELLKKQLCNRKNFTLNGPISNPIEMYLNDEEYNKLLKLREHLNSLDNKSLYQYFLKGEFPLDIIKELVKEFPEIMPICNKFEGLKAISENLNRAYLIELSKFDLSIFTFIVVAGKLCTSVIFSSSFNHKNEYLIKMANLQVIASFCLTEPHIGSEAHNLNTYFIKNGDKYLLNGAKRWIGNANHAHILIIFAKNNLNFKNINGFIVKSKQKGVKITKIEDKIPLRMVQNCEITLDNIELSEEDKISGIETFSNVAVYLNFSRLNICYGILGATITCYNIALNHANKRKQFNKELVGFQLIQKYLFEVRTNIEAMYALIQRISNFCDEGFMSAGKVGMLKAWTSKLARESMQICREILGGDGILYSNTIIKHLSDIEAVITYEGTYEINLLSAAKEITGKSAFY